MARLVDQIKEALAAFAGAKTSPALIGGLALAAHQVVRATQDVDFLADADDADKLHEVLTGLGYTCIHRSEDAANYVRGDEGLDLLYAHRPIARRLLDEAETRDTPMGRLRVISAEGLIAFKLQCSSRPAERESEVLLVRKGGLPYAPSGARDPFESLAELMEVVETLCPRWPARPRSLHEASFRL